MRKRNCIYGILIIGLCIIISAAQPLSAEASSAVLEEIEQTIPQEEIKSIETPQELSEPNSQSNTEEQNISPNTDNNSNNISEPNQPTEEVQTDNSNEIEQTEQEETVPKENIEKSYHVVPLKKIPIKKKSKKHFFSLTKIIDKMDSIIHNLSFNKYLSAKYQTSITPFLNKFHKKEQTHNTLSSYNFAPYYFINPSFEDNYLEKIVFPEEITNTAEFMPYSITARKASFKINAPKHIVTPRGITDISVLINAPSPKIKVLGKSKFAKLVIDIRNNTLYKYDKNGFPLKAYLVATGARGTRTMAGLRIVTYKEKFPYSGDPTSKRALDPYSYGPYIIFVNKIDPKTGRQCSVEQLLHGNGNEYSIGRKVSHGCVRTNNYVMKSELSKEVVRGDYILLINPDVE